VKTAALGGDVDFNGTSSDDARYEAFLELFSRHRDRIFAHIFSLVPHEADAEDLFQRCSIVLWRKFREFDQSGSFYAWSCGVAVNEVRNFFKVRKRSRVSFFPEPVELLSRERLADEEDLSLRAIALQSCLQQLRESERDLLRIAYWENQSLKEFAEKTEGSLQVLYNRLSKIRKRLYACIERKMSGEAHHG